MKSNPCRDNKRIYRTKQSKESHLKRYRFEMNDEYLCDDVCFHKFENQWNYSQDFEYSNQFVELVDVEHHHHHHRTNPIDSFPSSTNSKLHN